MNNAIDSTYFKTYHHVKHAVPDAKPKDLRKVLSERLHDKKMRLPQTLSYMRRIFERVPGCYFHDLLVQPGDVEPKYYHIFIGSNNRYAFAYPVNDKKAYTAVETLEQFINDVHKDGTKVVKLTSDGECAFNSEKFQNNYTDVDHINHDRTDYHISNLRFVSRSENNENKSSNLNVEYEFVDKIDDEAIEITDYGNHHFEFYYYVHADDSFYFYTGVNYRKLHINIDKRDNRAYISIRDNNNKQVGIFINKFKRLYGIDF